MKRQADGTFKESDDAGKALAADRRQKAKTKVKPGFADHGDQAQKKPSKEEMTKIP